ncbi:MAG: preprotein translocase subunit SecG [Planctomycetota bacterium]
MMSVLTPMLMLGLAGWLSGLLTLGFLFVCVVMILIVLIQRPQGGGLGGAFGSAAGSGQTAFGAKTGDALTIATIAIFVIFLLSAIGLNFAARPSEAPAQPAAAVAPESDAAEQLADDVSDAGAGADADPASDADVEPAADDAAEPAAETATESDAPAEGG